MTNREDCTVTGDGPGGGCPSAGLPRRLASIFYDSLLLAALIFIAAQPFPLIPGELQSSPLVRVAKQVYLLAVGWLYFGWFWTHSGQTVGMKAWRVKVVSADGRAVGWGPATRRYLFAIVSWIPLGLGFWWSLFDTRKRAYHDALSGTRLVVLPKPPKRKKGT